MSSSNSQDSDDEIEDCPICVEPFDDSDRLFFPCNCNYKVCMFCVRRLMTEFDGRCPGCRSVYNEANFRVKEVDPEEQERRRAKEKQKALERARQHQLKQQQLQQQNAIPPALQAKNARSQSYNQTGGPANKRGPGSMQGGSHISPQGGAQQGGVAPSQFSLHDSAQESLLAQQRKSLVNVRVVQNHVVFVLGLPLSLAKEEILRRPEHFGQYGPIVKIVVGHPASAPGRTASASAHITFTRAEDAREAIRGVDGVVVDGHQIRASFGTTRYCHAFLRGQHCHNPDCLFLHQEVDSATTQTVKDAKTATGTGVAAAGSVGVSGSGGSQSHHTPQSARFGGTDPFAVENVPEPLNGIDLVQYEKQRNRTNAAPATMGRAPGDGRPPPSGSTPPPPPGVAAQPHQPTNGSASSQSSHPVAYDCALSLVADLVMSRSQMPEDLRKTLAWIAGPREHSTQFSGLESVLASFAPMFIAPMALDTTPTVAGTNSAGNNNSAAVSSVPSSGGGSDAMGGALGSGKDGKKVVGRKGKGNKYGRGADAGEAY